MRTVLLVLACVALSVAQKAVLQAAQGAAANVQAVGGNVLGGQTFAIDVIPRGAPNGQGWTACQMMWDPTQFEYHARVFDNTDPEQNFQDFNPDDIDNMGTCGAPDPNGDGNTGDLFPVAKNSKRGTSCLVCKNGKCATSGATKKCTSSVSNSVC